MLLLPGSRCRFPEDWKGRYFQSGLGEIFIRDSHITTKGTCVEQSRDYFMLSNRLANCHSFTLCVTAWFINPQTKHETRRNYVVFRQLWKQVFRWNNNKGDFTRSRCRPRIWGSAYGTWCRTARYNDRTACCCAFDDHRCSSCVTNDCKSMKYSLKHYYRRWNKYSLTNYSLKARYAANGPHECDGDGAAAEHGGVGLSSSSAAEAAAVLATDSGEIINGGLEFIVHDQMINLRIKVYTWPKRLSRLTLPSTKLPVAAAVPVAADDDGGGDASTRSTTRRLFKIIGTQFSLASGENIARGNILYEY